MGILVGLEDWSPIMKVSMAVQDGAQHGMEKSPAKS